MKKLILMIMVCIFAILITIKESHAQSFYRNRFVHSYSTMKGNSQWAITRRTHLGKFTFYQRGFGTLLTCTTYSSIKPLKLSSFRRLNNWQPNKRY